MSALLALQIKAALEAGNSAIAPYSNFKVGAALATSDEKIYTGCNIESSSFGLTICAERVAIFKALSEGERNFKSIVIVSSAEEFCPPCGACRQVLSDFSSKLEVILYQNNDSLKTFSLAELLPEAFDASYLVSND